MRTARFAVLWSVFAIGVASGLDAQGVRGTVVDAGGTPVPGVIVLLLDARDSIESRALTNERGEYRVVAGRAGAYRLRSLRIGFRPTTSGVISLALGQEATQQLSLSGVPIALDTIRVSGRNACRTPYDSAAATFAVWEQARTALTAAQLTTGMRGVQATLVAYERTLEPDRERVVSQRSSIYSGVTRAIWRSPTSDSLRRFGYIVSNLDGSATYYAPELKVLLSDAFVEDHCFRLAGSRDTTRIGIAFEPNRDRRGIADIRGTLWLDRKSAELREMEFRYTNATRERMYGNAGGQMQFARTKNGAWIISSWGIRIPLLEQRQVTALGPGMRPTAPVTEVHVAELKVEGGEVALVTRGGDTLYARPPLPLKGLVVDSATGAPVPGATVTIRGANVSAVTDESGRFRIPDLLPGNYLTETRTKSLSAFGYIHAQPLTFIDSVTVHSLRLPTAAAIVERVCPVSHAGLIANRRDGLVAGTVRIARDPTPPRYVKVLAQWYETTATGARWGGIDAVPDDSGYFRICGLPLGTTIKLSAWRDSLNRSIAPVAAISAAPGSARKGSSLHGGVADVEYRIHDVGMRHDALSATVPVRLAQGTRFANVDLILDPGTQRGASFSGRVVTEVTGTPLPDVEVAIPELALNVFTNDSGTFRIDDIPAGTRAVTLRRVGYGAMNLSIAFVPNGMVQRTIMMRRVPTLDTVSVVAPSMREFDERRRLGLGSFLTRADIEKLQGRPIGATLSQMRGVGIYFSGRGDKAWILTKRGRTSDSDYWCPGPGEQSDRAEAGHPPCACYAQVYLNRALMNPPVLQGRGKRPTPPFDVHSIPSDMIEAIEWYSGPASTPPEYSRPGDACGVLVIHTRRSK